MKDTAAIDVYAVAAECYDLWASTYWAELTPHLVAALEGVQPGAGPVLELAAGTGLGTVAIADAVPGATILAVEPSRSMRGQLMSKVVARPDLRQRVTVVPADFETMTWPNCLGGFVALAMLGHLTPEARRRLWRELSDRLAPEAPAVVHLQPPERPMAVPFTRDLSERVGSLMYEGWSSAAPSGERSMQWTMTYRVLSEGTVVDEQCWTQDFETIAFDDVVAEAAAAGLDAERRDAGLVVLRGE